MYTHHARAPAHACAMQFARIIRTNSARGETGTFIGVFPGLYRCFIVVLSILNRCFIVPISMYYRSVIDVTPFMIRKKITIYIECGGGGCYQKRENFTQLCSIAVKTPVYAVNMQCYAVLCSKFAFAEYSLSFLFIITYILFAINLLRNCIKNRRIYTPPVFFLAIYYPSQFFGFP